MVSVHRRRFQILTAVSFLMNVVVMIHLKNSVQALPASIPREGSLSRLSRHSTAPREKSIKAVEGSGCRKRIIFFGLRQHWFTFCNYTVFSQYKYMIEFPRNVSCPEVDCLVEVDYTLDASDIKGHDIVVFTDVDSWMTPKMWDWAHGNRTDGQIWTMITEESPLYVAGVQPPKKYAASSFNWLDSYREDSDFVHPYGSYEKFHDADRPPPIDLDRFVVRKTRMIAWMGSHCETLQWDRMKFVKELNRTLGKHVHVHTYGRCGTRGEIPWNNDTIIQETLGSYKFYLSLENSCCDEYITEKFWRALEMGLVPVVVGAPLEHYNRFAPPNSFLHVDNYDSLEDLAIELLSLHTDDEAYLYYHRWRNEGILVSYGQEEQYVRPLNNQTQCALLGKLLKTDLSRQTKLDFFGPRWYGSCKSCGSKTWIQEFMHPKNHARRNADIWA